MIRVKPLGAKQDLKKPKSIQNLATAMQNKTAVVAKSVARW